jgi:alpha-glucosidase (family GH31 glycosyl hydrolase)
MLGDNILVAPVLEKGATTKRVFFPEGIWIGDDQSKVCGPCVQIVEAPLKRLPWYEKQ